MMLVVLLSILVLLCSNVFLFFLLLKNRIAVNRLSVYCKNSFDRLFFLDKKINSLLVNQQLIQSQQTNIQQAVQQQTDLLQDTNQQILSLMTHEDGIKYHHASQLLQQGHDLQSIMKTCQLSQDEAQMISALVPKNKVSTYFLPL